ncbi:MAG: TusE/DsrC/DsvC family sulfur relay protein [Thiomargarita sp.]|nr:TusE/DsrC/DsvC family sulfur relay protein [Thiomargarita sp.]
MALEVNGQSIETDEEGYLINPEEWTEDIAKYLAEEEKVEMIEEHWKIIYFMRDYYTEHQVPVDVRFVTKYLINELGYGKKEAKKHLFELFPYGYVKQACKIAGMKRPRIWSTG